MTRDEEYFLQLVCAAVGDIAPPLPHEVDWHKVYKLCTLHSVRGMVYPYIKSICDDEMLLEEWENAFVNISCIMANFEYETTLVIEKYIKDKIAHTIFKGYILRDYYPYKDMRTMGDVDMLVLPEDIDTVFTIMSELGYLRINAAAFVHTYKKGDIEFEIHTKIIYSPISKNIDCTRYFENYNEHTTILSNEYTKTFLPEYHLIYLIMHILKHFYFYGFGVRMITDIVVLVKHFDSLDWRLIWTELEKLDMVKFANYVFYLCNSWFNCKIDITAELQKEQVGLFAENVLTGGVFSSATDEEQSELIAKPVRISGFLKPIFPSFLHMTYNYSYLKKHPFLLPLAWLQRIYKIIFIEKAGAKRSVQKIKTLSIVDDVQKKQLQLAEKLGLKKEMDGEFKNAN